MIGSLESIKHLDILKYYITYLHAGNNFAIPMKIVKCANRHYNAVKLFRNSKTDSRSENCRQWVLANRHSRNWELYSSRLHTESYNTPHWSDRQTGFPRIL